MPRADHFPNDIMDKHQAFADAVQEYLTLVEEWEVRRFDPRQPRAPAGQPNGGQWVDHSNVTDGATPALAQSAPTPGSATREPSRPDALPMVLRPLEAPAEGAPFATDVASRPGAARFYVQLQTVETYFQLYVEPVFVDPILGFPRSTAKSYIGPSDMTRPGVFYIEAASFAGLKGLLLPATPGFEFHHIVEQSQWEHFTDRPNDPRAVHNTSNIVLLEESIHDCVTEAYTTNIVNGLRLREYLKGKPYSFQYYVGLEAIKDCKSGKKYQQSTSRQYDQLTDQEANPFGFTLPLPPPRIFLKDDAIVELSPFVEIKAFDLETFMDSTDLTFELDRYRLMLEELHDAAVDSKKDTIERANRLRDAAWRYLQRVHKTEVVWTDLRSLLTHPKKMVRVWVAVEMLSARRTEGWATLVTDVVPGAGWTGDTEEERTKNRAAHMFGYLTMMTRAKFFDDLNLTPSLSEMEDLWLAEGRIGHRFIRLD